MWANARNIGVSHQIVQRAIKKNWWNEPCEDGEATLDTNNERNPSRPMQNSFT
uniref:Uncharacterized protein n=1 Tax=Lepeophtheirus salmonis TaxID=72036 RepID=A0A0K2TAB9_LEPSM